MTATEQYIHELTNLKPGASGLLRTHAGQGLDQSVQGFDLFAGLWWPLRQKNQAAPRREVAWLIAKLYAAHPNIAHATGCMLASQISRCLHGDERERLRFRDKFDQLLLLSLNDIEPALSWVLGEIASHDPRLDWARLTDDLSIWERETTRLKWAEQFLQNI